MSKRIQIVGGGLVGSLLSLLLVQRGYTVKVFERRPDLRKSDISAGKSINLALSNRGWKPLKMAGIDPLVQEMVIPMNGRMMHDLQGSLSFQPYGRKGQFINSVSRGGLNALLITEAERLGASYAFDVNIESIDLDRTRLIGDTTQASDILIGADGAFSLVRRQMQRMDRFNYSQEYISHGYKELSIPASAAEEFQLDPGALHIWPRGEFMLIALPNLDKSFTVTLFLPFEGDHSFESLSSSEAARVFFEHQFPDAVSLMPDFHSIWAQNPVGSLVTVKCFPWTYGNTMLIGDAAHAIVPFYGQGMNCGFEDCKVLMDLLDKCQDNWEQVLPMFQASRKANADAIADLAIQNYTEMRDLVADDNFLLRKKIESRIHELFPDRWIPQYSMVTFHEEIPYSTAKSTGERQSAIMDEVMRNFGEDDSIENLDFDAIVRQLN